MANALSKNPTCLDQIEEEKARKVSMLSEERPDNVEKVRCPFPKIWMPN